MIEAELPDGRVLEFPDGTDPQVVQSTVRRVLGVQPQAQEDPVEPEQSFRPQKGEVPDPNDPVFQEQMAGATELVGYEGAESQQDTIAGSIAPLAAPLAEPAFEGMAAVNRGLTKAADFLSTDQINALSELFGAEFRAPSITEKTSAATEGGFMLEGLPRDVIRQGGELVAPGIAGGQVARSAAQQLPRFSGRSEGTLAGAIRQAGNTTPGIEARVAAGSGAGSQIGGAAGERVGGETGRQVGEVIGGLGGAAASMGRGVRQTGEVSRDARIPRGSQESGQVDDFARATSPRADNAVDQGVAGMSPERAARNRQREEAFTRMGAKPTEAQRTRDRELFVQQQDLYKQGGKVTQALERQEEIFSQRAREALEATGGDPFMAPASPIETVVTRSLKADKRISDLYKQASENLPGEKVVRFDNATETLRSLASQNQLTGGVVAALRGALNETGAVQGFKPSGKISVEAAERIRQTANSLFPSTNPQGKEVIRRFKEALDQDVGKAVGGDFFKEARAAKASFERGLDRTKFNKFDEREVNIVRDILTNRLTPDDIQNGALFRAGSRYKAQDLKELKNYLSAGDGDDALAGLKAWDDIKAAGMETVMQKAFSGPQTERGTQSLSRAGLERAIRSMGREKFNTLFDAPERKFLADLAEVASYKEPVPGAQLGSGPSGQAIQNAADRIDEKMDRLLGFRVPFASSILGAVQGGRAERKVLQLMDDLAEIEKAQIKESIRRAKQKGGVSGAAVGITDTAEEEENDPNTDQ